MATKISEYSSTPASNTDLDGINLSENVMVPSDVNDALRMQMAHLKDLDTGTSALTSPEFTSATISGGTIDNSVIGGTTPAAGSFTNVTASGTVDGRDVSVDGAKLDGIEASADVTDATNVAAAGALMTTGGTVTGDISFGDNNKAIFGSGNDLSVFHDGSHSYVSDAGTGNLQLSTNGTAIKMLRGNGEVLGSFNIGGSVDLYHSNAKKFETTASGISVTGTVTADGLTVDGDATIGGVGDTVLFHTNANVSPTYFSRSTVTDEALAIGVDDNDVILNSIQDERYGGYKFQSTYDGTGTRTRMEIEQNSGDISFYDNTGVSQGFLWDASTQRLGIGSTAPQKLLHLQASGGATARFQSTGARVWDIGNDATTITAFVIDDVTAGQERFRIASDGSVGIGTQSPSTILDVEGANINFASSENGILNVFSNDATAVNKGGSISLGGNSESGSLGFAMIKGAKQSTDAGYLAFGTRSAAANSTEHMRLDSGGKLNVNNTTGSARVNISADNWPENALALYSAGIAGQTNFAGMGFFNQDADSPIGQVADIYTNPTGTLSLTASGNPAIQLKYGSHGISGGTPALTVDNAGNVGIGITAPASKLHVETATTGLAARISKGGNKFDIGGLQSGTAYIKGYEGTVAFGNEYAGNLTFLTANTERLRVTASGRLLVNTTNASPSNISSGTVGGCSFGEDNGGEIASDAYNVFQINKLNSTSGGLIAFRYNASQVGYIGTNGTTTSYNTSSDYRLKENVTAITSATNRLNQLNPVRFNFIADADTTVDGFIAHEVATVIPEAISGEKDEVDADGNAVMQGIDQSKLVPLLTAALQEALTKIDQLETRITALEA